MVALLQIINIDSDRHSWTDCISKSSEIIYLISEIIIMPNYHSLRFFSLQNASSNATMVNASTKPHKSVTESTIADRTTHRMKCDYAVR